MVSEKGLFACRKCGRTLRAVAHFTAPFWHVRFGFPEGAGCEGVRCPYCKKYYSLTSRLWIGVGLNIIPMDYMRTRREKPWLYRAR